ncbi:MAG: 23S rRNA (adenine(2503)-C(2))-methyltransferase RlmN [Prevotellaceae bacterium]|jgi:23S rRNA (adenine2503-C2)-methyltransferase|nr:23S rRNA (adenine(2503)-C(2))-methyltransferase RlmN [Prevotellaceae bacterium]
MPQKSLLGKNLIELQHVVSELKMPKFTAKQLAEWLYTKNIVDFAQITNISKQNIEVLSQLFEVGRQKYEVVTKSTDGTKKYLFKTENGFIEAVYMPEKERNTLCVSCQVGCKMGCDFCMTGKLGFSGNLSAGEIINQVLSIENAPSLTNIVFMGMGEPFDNTANVLKAIEILTSDWGFAWSPKRITVSTVGLMQGMKEFLEQTTCHLAVSLHNPFSDERATMIPAEKAFGIEKIVAELRNYDFAHQRRVSFEYIVFDGINDTQRHATAMVKLLKGSQCRVNLIKFHSVETLQYKSPNLQKMEWFRDYLSENHIITTIRRSRGEDIAAACGQLKAERTMNKAQ